MSSRGTVVGHVVVRGEHPAVVSMNLPGWDALVRSYGSAVRSGYALAVGLHDGSHHVVALRARLDGRWSAVLTGRARDVDSVSIVDGAGQPWCSARLT